MRCGLRKRGGCLRWRGGGGRLLGRCLGLWGVFLCLGWVRVRGGGGRGRCRVGGGGETRVLARRIELWVYGHEFCGYWGGEQGDEVLPAFRFRYREEKVAREPIRMLRYARGTTRPIQSTILGEVGWPRPAYGVLSTRTCRLGLLSSYQRLEYYPKESLC